MVQDIIYQISVFGDFTSIKPNTETVDAMITRFRDYGLLPAVFQEGSFTFPSNTGVPKAETTNRLQMVSFEKNINVMFASNRLDINRASTDLTIGVTNDNLNELLDILNKAASGLSFTRIGFNTTSLLNNPSTSLLQKIQPRLTLYNDPNELMLRVNKRNDIAVGDNSNEQSNVILTAQKTMGQLLINNQPISVDNGLILQFDINTIAENSEPRFFSEQTNKYIVSAEYIRQSLLNDLTS